VGQILVAEDDSELRALLTALLRRDGFDVVDAPDGTAVRALARAVAEGRAVTPDLVVMDVRMPGGSGIELLGELRRAGWRAPIVLMTAFGDANLHRDANAAGASAVLDKPFDLDELRREVRRLIA
jgi:DNA-binding response OmpR family regulator